jgi:hypothetical protein
MKTIIKTTSALALLFATATATANETKIGNKAFEVERLTKKETTRPVFRKKGEKIYMNLLNLDLEKVNIKVIDSENRVVFSEVIEGELLIQKAFNFERAFEDNYTVVVKDSEGTYREKLLVK